MFDSIRVASNFGLKERAVAFCGDCKEFLLGIPDETIQLVVTSPPYNIGKEYERRLHLRNYIDGQKDVIRECVRVLKRSGSLCWQVGNYVENGAIVPLDTILYPLFNELGLKMRNRIIWHFEHGLHCSKRFSGRYETVMWFTKTDDYVFDLDPVRVPQKYPGKKYFKGPKAGQYSCNPLGKSPGDVWSIPNVKSNHVEKTNHPCQFPVELVERFILSLSNEDDWVLDPFLGVGSTIIAAIRHNRRGAGAEIYPQYLRVALERIKRAIEGTLEIRPMTRPVFDPKDAGTNLTTAPWLVSSEANGVDQMTLLDQPKRHRERK